MMWSSPAVLVFVLAAFATAIPTKAPDYDTIIVGLGAAGCTAANTLCKAGKKVLALEAQNRIGGRVNTVPFGDGLVELGAEWIHGSEHSRVYELATQHNVSIIPQPLTSEVYRSDGSRGDDALLKKLVEYCLSLVWQPPETPEPMGEFMTRKLTAYIEQNYPDILKDKDFMNELFHYMDILADGYVSSSSWNDVSTYTNYVPLQGNQELSWHRHGYKTLFEILLNTYNNGPGLSNLDIKLNKEVVRITWPQDPEGQVEVTCKDGSVYTARNVIVTVSVGVLKERKDTLFTAPLPQKKLDAINNISIGVVMKIMLSFDHAWWNTSSDFFWRGVDKEEIAEEDLWTTDVQGGTVVMGCDNCLSFWLSGKHVKKVETLPENEVKNKLMAVIRRFMGKNKTIPEPTGMLRTNWFSNPFTRGTYSYDDKLTPQHPTARADLAAPLEDGSGAPRVLFAGEATDTKHFSTVHGATDSGFREATRILSADSNDNKKN